MASIKENIVDMVFSGAGIRDTAITLKIGISRVTRTLKTRTKANNVFASQPYLCRSDRLTTSKVISNFIEKHIFY